MNKHTAKLDFIGALLLPILVIVIITTMLSGCGTYAGLVAHTTGVDRPESNLENPVFVFGSYNDFGQFVFYCEHHSGLLVVDAGAGYNLCGVRYYFDENRPFEH